MDHHQLPTSRSRNTPASSSQRDYCTKHTPLGPTLRPARHMYVHMQNPRCKFSWRNKPRRIESNHLTSPSTRFSPKSQEPGARAMCTYMYVRTSPSTPYHPCTRNAAPTNRANSRSRIQNAGAVGEMKTVYAAREGAQVSSPQLTPDGLDRVGRLRSQMRDRDRG